MVEIDKKIVIGAHFHWHSFLHIGSHQYAKQFARNGYKVAYISKFISPFHFVFAKDRAEFRTKYFSWKRGGEWIENKKIWNYVPFSFFPRENKLFLRSKWSIENCHKFSFPSLNRMLKKNSFNQVDLVFLDEAYDFLLDLVSYRKSVLRLHDDLSYLYEKGYKNFLVEENSVIRKVDVVIATSRKLEALAKKKHAKKVLYLPNAVDFGHFFSGSHELPKEYKYIKHPRVIYIGSITDWFDIDLFKYTAIKLSDVSFVIIGKPMVDLSALAQLPNVFILGVRDYKIIPSYQKHADVGIIPWKLNQWVRSSCPNKLFQYMASGLPVVSMKWEEIDKIESPAYLASGYDEFVNFVKIAIEDKDIKKNLEFAKANSWENRYEELMAKISSEELEK